MSVLFQRRERFSCAPREFPCAVVEYQKYLQIRPTIVLNVKITAKRQADETQVKAKIVYDGPLLRQRMHLSPQRSLSYVPSPKQPIHQIAGLWKVWI